MLIKIANVLKTYKSIEAGKRSLEPYKYIFPIRSSEILAGIVGDLFGDGHLQGEPKWRLDFTSSSIKELKRFEKEFYTLFKIKGKIRRCTTNKFGKTYNYGVNCKPIARSLFLCGVPTGNKVLKRINIPTWILTNKRCFRRFLQRLFNCEATVDLYSKCIELRMNKEKGLLNNGFRFFKDIKKCLRLFFKIETTKPFLGGKLNIRKDGFKTIVIRIKIKRKESVIRFAEEIGFENNKKQKSLKRMIMGWKDVPGA